MTQLNNMNFRPFDKDTTPAELYELRDVMTTFAAGSMDASDGYFYITMGPEMGKPPTLWDGPFRQSYTRESANGTEPSRTKN